MPLLLLADDNRTTQKVVELTLQPHGFQVESFPSLEALLDSNSRENADAVMISSSLSAWNGADSCALIRQEFGRPRLPIIVSVGVFEESTREEKQRLGCDALLSKPFESAALLDAVKTLLSAPADRTEKTATDTPPSTPETQNSIDAAVIPEPPLELEIPVRTTKDSGLMDLRPKQCRATLTPLRREVWKP